MAVVHPVLRESPLPCLGKLGQSTRRRRNLQHSFSSDFANVKLDQALTNYCQTSTGHKEESQPGVRGLRIAISGTWNSVFSQSVYKYLAKLIQDTAAALVGQLE